ncbi:MAG TPA: autotransporter-associated beta strand repeat-containing protein [Verrucomicrobiae bacterium]|nr:autotransporter-associated beta strand repeat-containing protein [Verrucomicrobiae bacterium]
MDRKTYTFNRKALAALLALTSSGLVSQAADFFWSGGTGTYNNPAAWGGTVPGTNDNAINASGINNVVQINGGDPDWTVNDLSAGGATNGAGAYAQNGQTLNVRGWMHIGDGENSVGAYTLNNGTLNVLGGRLFLGERPGSTSTLNINGGVLNKSGDLFVIADGGWNGPGARTAVVNQNGGVVNSSSEIWIGQVALADATYNLHAGGTINSSNWFVVARAGATGVMNMDGGVVNHVSGGQPAFIVADGGGSVGTLNHSAGTINCLNTAEFWIGNGGSSSGTYNLSGSATLNVNNWIAVGRGGTAVLNLSGGTINKTGGGNVVIPGNGVGAVEQTGGSFNVTGGEVWLPENGNGAWNISGGTASVGLVSIGRVGGSVGVLNLNGGVFRAAEITTGNVGAFSTVNFNGGTLQAAGNNNNFLHDLTLANVQPGGIVLDSQGFDITISQALGDAGGGGLVKNGTGTVRLTGANSYQGSTVVNAGRLFVTSNTGGGGDYSFANNTTLGVTVLPPVFQLNMANLTLGTGGNVALDVDLGSFGNPTAAPINVVNQLAVNGTVAITLADTMPQLGSFPLIKYGARTGSGNFVLASVPVGVGAAIVTNNVDGSIDIQITSVNLPRWDGQAGGNWDIGITTNWVNIGTGTPTTFGDGNAVVLDDNAQGTTTVNLVTTVSPSSVTVNNSALDYTLTGSGRISGAARLTKQGSGTLTIANSGGNNYTGPTIVSNGVLSVNSLANGGAASSIGASTADPANLVLGNDSTLRYTGPAAAINRGYTVTGTNSTFDLQTPLSLAGTVVAVPNSATVKRGPATLTYSNVGSNTLSGALSGGLNPGYHVAQGTLVFNGTGNGQTNRVMNEMWVGGSPDFGASLVVSNATLLIDSWLGVGRGNGSIGNTSSVLLHNARVSSGALSLGYANNLPGNLASQVLTLSGETVYTNRGEMNLSESEGSSAIVTIRDNSILGSSGRLLIGHRNASTGSVTIANSGRLIVNSYMSIGNETGGMGSMQIRDNASLRVATDLNVTDTGSSAGTLTLQDNGSISSGPAFIGKAGGTVATFNMSGGLFTVRGSGQNFRVAQSGGSTGTVNLSGGTISVGSETWIGEAGNGTMNQTGGAVWSTNWVTIGRNGGSTGVYNISAGSLNELNSGNRLIVGENGNGTLNISGSAQVTAAGEFLVAGAGAGVGTVNLDGGTLTAPRVYGGAGNSTFNFNGGTLRAAGNVVSEFFGTFTTASVKSGGAMIDSGNNTINIGQALLDGGGNGGLTKLGSGTLNLNGVNTYAGATLVNAGTLGGSGTIAGPVSVAAGAQLAPGAGIGTLTINNALTLAGTSTTRVEVSADGGLSTDRVNVSGTVTYGGSLIVSNAGTNALTAGSVFKVFNAGAVSGNFASVTLLPTGTATFNPATGEVTITSVGAPILNRPVLSGGNLILTGTGAPGAAVTLLTTTNLANGVWTTNTAGVFDSNGVFSNAIPVNVSEPARFFQIRQP